MGRLIPGGEGACPGQFRSGKRDACRYGGSGGGGAGGAGYDRHGGGSRRGAVHPAGAARTHRRETSMRNGILILSLALAAGPAFAADPPADDPVHQGKKLSEWIKQLQDDKDAEARGDAAHAIGVMGRKAKAAVPALTKALKDKDEDVRDWACYALSNMGADGKEALPGLEELLLNDKVKHVRRAAAVAIGSMHAEGKAAVPSLRKTLKDPDPWMRHFSAVALGAVGEGAKDAVPDLVKAFGDDEYVVQKSAVEAVGDIGPAAKEAVPALIKVWKDPEEYKLLRQAAATSIKQIDPEAAKKAGVP
jgi:hypothetical protein